MNTLLIRSTLLLVHAVLNFILVSRLLDFDLTGKWIYFAGFILLVLLLIYLFIRHTVYYIYLLKTKTK